MTTTPEVVPGAGEGPAAEGGTGDAGTAAPEAPMTRDLLADLPEAPATPKNKGWLARLISRRNSAATPAIVTTEGAPDAETPLEPGDATFAEANEEEVPAMPSRSRELWNNLRQRNPITGPRVKTAKKALGILAAVGLATGLVVVGGKKVYEDMTDGAEVTPPVVEPVPVTQSPWTVRAGEMTDAECDMHLMNTRGKDAVIIDCDNIKNGAQICNDEGLDTSDATFKYDAITVKGFQPIPTPENCASGEHLQATLVR